MMLKTFELSLVGFKPRRSCDGEEAGRAERLAKSIPRTQWTSIEEVQWRYDITLNFFGGRRRQGDSLCERNHPYDKSHYNNPRTSGAWQQGKIAERANRVQGRWRTQSAISPVIQRGYIEPHSPHWGEGKPSLPACSLRAKETAPGA